ncbi:hypothetical protein D9M68_857370 [compost metagenome]
MAKKQAKQQERREVSGLERLGMRVTAMINAPLSQLNRRVTIHRLDTDADEAWEGVMGLLAEEDSLDMTFNDDGTVTLRWEAMGEEGREVQTEGWQEPVEMVVENLAEAPF